MKAELIVHARWRQQPYRVGCDSVKAARRQAKSLGKSKDITRIVLRVHKRGPEVLKDGPLATSSSSRDTEERGNE